MIIVVRLRIAFNDSILRKDDGGLRKIRSTNSSGKGKKIKKGIVKTQLKHKIFNNKRFFKLNLSHIVFKAPGANFVGSPHTNFWLLYTFKVLNILICSDFYFL
jgi:hypothetical protein